MITDLIQQGLVTHNGFHTWFHVVISLAMNRSPRASISLVDFTQKSCPSRIGLQRFLHPGLKLPSAIETWDRSNIS